MLATNLLYGKKMATKVWIVLKCTLRGSAYK